MRFVDDRKEGDKTPPTCAKTPCASCPYRRDVPSGIWHEDEYRLLPTYDGETHEQYAKGAMRLFFCHQRNGKLCAGWLGCHDKRHLLAIRMRPVAPEVFTYVSPVPLFASGAEAMEHGMKNMKAPDLEARRKQLGIMKLQRVRRLKRALDPHTMGET